MTTMPHFPMLPSLMQVLQRTWLLSSRDKIFGQPDLIGDRAGLKYGVSQKGFQAIWKLENLMLLSAPRVHCAASCGGAFSSCGPET